MPLPRPFRLVARQLSHRPGHSLLVIAMLAVAIAGNSAIFAVVHSLFFEPLAFDESERLVALDIAAPEWGRERVRVCYSDFHQWRQGSRAFEAMALVKPRSFNLVAGDRVERIDGAMVTHDLLEVLREQPLLGRMFDAAEDRPGGPKVVVLGHGTWQRLFAGAEDVIGRTLRLDGEAYEVVGVLPKRAVFPAEADIWLPVAGDPETDYGAYHLDGIGRLAEGVTPEMAKSELDGLMAGLHERWPFKKATSAVVIPLRDEFVGDHGSAAWGLQAAVFLVLLIACSNVAALMLARGGGRAREISVRMALGADRGKVARELLAESLALALIGGLLGLWLSGRALSVLDSLLAEQLPFWVRFESRIDVMLISLIVCTVTVLVFGLGPAWRTTRVDLQSSLRTGAAGSGLAPDRARWLAGLVVVEMALAQLLLVGAGLLVVSQGRLGAVDPGFRTENMLAFRIALPAAEYPEDHEAVRFFDALQARLAALPGVTSATVADHPPLFGHDGYFMEIEGQVIRGTEQDGEVRQPLAQMRFVHENYAEALGLSLLSGRFLRIEPAAEEAPLEAVVNRSFAESFWGEVDVVGRRTRFRGDDSPWLRIVGVAENIRNDGPAEPAEPAVYLPRGMVAKRTMVAVVETEVEPYSILPAVRLEVGELDSGLPLFDLTTLGEEWRESVAMRRLSTRLFGLFALIALALAAGGTYGVVAHGVDERRREIGVRLALGATPGGVWGQMLARGAGPVILGSISGLAAALVGVRGLEALLFGVNPFEPMIFAAVVSLLGLVALLANGIPAWRAVRLDPMRALREE